MHLPSKKLFYLLILVAFSRTAMSAEPGAPARFRIRPTISQADLFRFTATIGSVPTGTIAYGAYEPFVFRTKWELTGDAPNELVVDRGDWRAFRLFKDGFWDGARVRVYRIRNGRMVKVRDDRIADGGHTSSGWMQVKLGRDWANLIDPSETTARLRAGRGWRMNVPYWYRVIAVRRGGAISPATDPVRVVPTEGSRGKEVIKTVRQKGLRIGSAKTSPSAPGGLTAVIDDEGGVVLNWRPAAMKDLAGYRIEITDVDPDQHRGLHLRLAGRAGEEGQETLKGGDIAFIGKTFRQYSRKQYVHHLSYGARDIAQLISHKPRTNSFVQFFGDEIEGKTWRLAEHPGQLPEDFTDAGDTCLELKLDEGKSADVLVGRHGDPDQDWYKVLRANTEYVVEARIRTDRPGAKVSFQYSSKADPVTFHPDASWKLHRATFDSGPLGSLVNGKLEMMNMIFTGPGTFWIDNTRVYPADEGYLRAADMGLRRARQAGLHAVRYHSHIKSGWSYTMEMLTNTRGVVGKKGARNSNNPNTLPSLLDFTRDVGANPWMQIEMCMSEEEWLGLVEYLAAPYDPDVDTPEEKPWAHKRYTQGQKNPWINEFNKIYFEISNETWNWSFAPWIFYPGHVDEATGRLLDRGEVYGLLHAYVMQTMRSSPYWTDAVEAKWEDVMGGWSSNASDAQGGYGPNAIAGAPRADHLTVAAYNGGWDVGEKAAKMTDASLFRSATFFIQHREKAKAPLDVRAWQVAAGLTPRYEFGTYEAGPGYALPGRTTRAQQEAQDQVGKSLATGMATLDTFAGRAALGYGLQNFFTMNFGRRHWTSFQPMHKGGEPYPSWMGLVLFNREGTGDFLAVETLEIPTTDLKAFAKRPERPDAPLVAVYPTVRGDRVNLLVLSRKVDKVLDENGDGKINARDDGWTPVTLQLPFAKARSVTLHTMTGNPRWHNLDEKKVAIRTRKNGPFAGKTFALTREVTGLGQDGMPPASALLFVFEGTDLTVNRRPDVAVKSPVEAEVGAWTKLFADATDPDKDPVSLTWDLGNAGTWDETRGEARFTRSGNHRIHAVADDGNGGITRRLCLVRSLVQAADHKWVLADVNDTVTGMDPVTTEGGSLNIPARGNFRVAPWLYAADTRLSEKGSVTIRLVGKPTNKGELLAGLSLRGTTTDWKLWRTPHVSLIFQSDRGDPKSGTVWLDDRRGPRRNQRPDAAATGLSLPLGVGIERDGKLYVGKVSRDGKNWQKIGVIDGPERSLPRHLYVGILAGSDSNHPTRVAVDDVSIFDHSK